MGSKDAGFMPRSAVDLPHNVRQVISCLTVIFSTAI